ncbi:MAG: hypothetical protein J6T29_02395 [Alphaproteobacteria bacterium]|nr:hypothetical protein [Alphaproteobacteria bacterium]
MKKYVLFILTLLNSFCVDNVISMEPRQANKRIRFQETYFVSDFDNTDEVVRKIWMEGKECKFDTQHKVLEAAEKGDEKAFEIIQKLLNKYFSGLSYTVANAIYEKKFVSASMTEILLKNEEVQDALNEITHGNDVERIILEGTGTEKHWMEVLRDARNGDKTSFAVIMELLEKKYLLDLPFIIAQSLGKGFFDEETEKAFSENASVKKFARRLDKYGEWNEEELNLIFI